MFDTLHKFVNKIKKSTKTDNWFTLGIYVLIGIVVAFLIRGNEIKAVAQNGSDQEIYGSHTDLGIDITHIPPVIAGTNDEVQLEFLISCPYAIDTEFQCYLDVTLFAAYGLESDFESKTLTKELRDSMEIWSISLPAADSNGLALHYFLEVIDKDAMVKSRYPLTGTVELAIASTITKIDLSSSKPTNLEGDLILYASWGNGPDQVGLIKQEEQVALGPSAFDMAPDEKIAVLDEVNQRVLLFDLRTNETIAYPVKLNGWGDIAFTNTNDLLILDLVGENKTPQLYKLNTTSDKIDNLGPVFVSSSADLTSDSIILDTSLGRSINPIDSNGDIKSKEDQIQSYSVTGLLARWQNNYHSLFADTQEDLFFDIQSLAPLGAISYFYKTDSGYFVIFEEEFLRILRISNTGQILSDSLVANQQESPIYHFGRFTVDQNGRIYYLNTTQDGIEIRRIDMKAEANQ